MESLTRCWARLRFVLREPGLVDEATIDTLDEVAIAVRQHGQYQIALRRGLLETSDDLTVLLRRSGPPIAAGPQGQSDS